MGGLAVGGWVRAAHQTDSGPACPPPTHPPASTHAPHPFAGTTSAPPAAAYCPSPANSLAARVRAQPRLPLLADARPTRASTTRRALSPRTHNPATPPNTQPLTHSPTHRLVRASCPNPPNPPLTTPPTPFADWYALSAVQSGLVVSLSLAGALLGSGVALLYGDQLGRKRELLAAAALYGERRKEEQGVVGWWEGGRVGGRVGGWEPSVPSLPSADTRPLTRPPALPPAHTPCACVHAGAASLIVALAPGLPTVLAGRLVYGVGALAPPPPCAACAWVVCVGCGGKGRLERCGGASPPAHPIHPPTHAPSQPTQPPPPLPNPTP